MNIGTLIKLALLAGGAIAGAIIARWLDDKVMEQAKTQSEQDRQRYAQGLSPLEQQRSTSAGQIHTVETFSAEEEI
jgi:uncharacterized membrane-anchored protein YhcB (DUF1043 family)